MYKNWIAKGLEKGIKDLEIYAVRTKGTNITVYEGVVENCIKSDVELVSIRGIYRKKLAKINFENLSDENVDKALDELIKSAKAVTTSEPAIIYAGSRKYPVIVEDNFDFEKVSMDKKIIFTKELESLVLKNKKVSKVQTTVYQENEITTTIVNSKGLNLSRSSSFAYAYAMAVLGSKDDIVTSYEFKLAKDFNDFDAKKIANETIKKGISKLGADTISTGEYPVVFSNEMFSEIMGAYSSIFSGEQAYRSLTPLKDKVGSSIANSNITFIEDPLNKKANFKTPFDDEGVVCKKKKIIDKGVFTGFIHNLKTAKIMKQKPTGNGFVNGIDTTNLFLEPTKLKFNDMIKDIKEAVYITDLVGLHAGINLTSGDFSLQASGFMIENGKITDPVKMIVVSGNFFEVLKNIEKIANDLKFDLSGFGSPSIYVKKLTIAGSK